jgi:glycosyltransferase involved in cell wall biosynthesis
MIFHIDTEKQWRGGQQQAFYLHKSLCQSGIPSIMICKKDSIMSKKCLENGLPFKCLPLLSEVDLYSALALIRLIKRNKAKILHLHTAHALSIGLLTKTFYRKIRLIAVRRVDFSIRKNFLSYYKYSNKLIDTIICISQNILKVMIDDGISADKLRLIYSGIDTQRYSQPNLEDKKAIYDLYNIPHENLIIGTIAAFVGHKDYPTLLNAAKIVLTECKNVSFIAIGDGHLRDEILELHTNLDLGNSFIMPGFQENIGKYLNSYDIFVLSSKMEGLGTSVLDAMSARKPIVACNSGGIPEMIKHEVNGLLAEKENPVDLAEKLLQLVNDRDLREKLASKAVQDVQDFSINNTINKNIELYKEFL